MLDHDRHQEKFRKCLNYLFDLATSNKVDLTEIINHECEFKNVPLHHATNYWDHKITSKLFEFGAMSSVGMINNDEEQPISKISPKVSFLTVVTI